jgi:hypothetical protein
MKSRVLLVLVTAAAFSPAPERRTMEFQYSTGGVMVHVEENAASGTVTGQPVSGSEEQHSLQVLGDGTRIEHTENKLFYRDDKGRTRTESADGRIATIQDPVDGFTIVLDADAKTGRRGPLPHDLRKLRTNIENSLDRVREMRDATMVLSASKEFAISTGGEFFAFAVSPNSNAKLSQGVEPATEDLGTQSLNGISARGTRTTFTIPAGDIGNDRPISVVSERWYSPELQMTIQSSNKDPRFAETTYQFTNIKRTAPPASLFQIPAEYTLIDGGKAQVRGFSVGPQ